MKKILYLLLFALCQQGCGDKEREEALSKREQALQERERKAELLEAEYQFLLKMRDSLLISGDSTVQLPAAWPASIAGSWQSKIVCVASACTDYVVGDQRADIWEFAEGSAGLMVKAVNSNKLVRVYAASFDNNTISLRFATDTAQPRQVVMNVVLSEITDSRIKGVRSVTVDNKCTAMFSVDLSRSAGK